MRAVAVDATGAASSSRPARFAGLAWILALLGAGCGADPGEAKPLTLATVAAEVSDCGGFARAASVVTAEAAVEPPAYCDAEVLRWVHDPVAQSLTVTDTRVSLNCCGSHAMTMACTTQGCTATETDAPQNGSTRCRCSCVFDFQVVATPFAAAEIPLTLARDITDDSAAPAMVWSGVLDLSTGSGIVVIDDQPVMMGCEPTAP